ncbi:hypothetical protein C7S17_3078 [Burkholderia thailandensis]|nr:hypothetical protein [Burkholderia thailandensis]
MSACFVCGRAKRQAPNVGRRYVGRSVSIAALEWKKPNTVAYRAAAHIRIPECRWS